MRDWQTPAGAAPAIVEDSPDGSRRGLWDPVATAALAGAVAAGARRLGEAPGERLAAAWRGAVEELRDGRSETRRRLDPALAAAVRLSPAGLAAGLEAVLGGVAGERAEAVFSAAERRGPPASPAPVLIVLAGNLPALAVQPLLPALALRRPAIVKSASAEPRFAPAFVRELARREPAVGEAVAAVSWRGGDAAVEAPLLAACDPVLAYGDAAAVADLEWRASGRVIAYGPKTSLAALGAGTDPAAVAAGLARDVALFDQRGCLSVAAVYVEGEGLAREVAERLAAELATIAEEWPPGPATAGELAAVRHARDEAAMAGARLLPLDPAAGTVLLDPRPAFRPTPGRRTVRVHPLAGLAGLPALLVPWSGRLQGVALAGLSPAADSALRATLAPLGVSRFTAPGRLQHPDVRWHNGGVDPLEVLS